MRIGLTIYGLAFLAFLPLHAQESRYLMVGGGLNMSAFYRTLDSQYGKLRDQSFREGFGACVG